MPRKSFTDSDDERLIEAVGRHRVLYDHEHRDGRNVAVKTSTWLRVADIVGRDTESCKKRWRDIRDNYHKIQRKLKIDPNHSSSRWPLMNRLHFLGCVRKSRRTAFPKNEPINMDEATSDSERGASSSAGVEDRMEYQPFGNYTFQSQQQQSESRLLSKSSSKLEEMERLSRKSLELLTCMANGSSAGGGERRDDDVDLFMKSVALSVKKLPPPLVTRAKRDILSAVSRIEEEAHGLAQAYAVSGSPSPPQDLEGVVTST